MPAIVKMMINGTRVVYLPVGDTSGICCKTRDQKREVDKLKSSRQKKCMYMALAAHSVAVLLRFCRPKTIRLISETMRYIFF